MKAIFEGLPAFSLGIMLCASFAGCGGGGGGTPTITQPPASNSAPIIDPASFTVDEDTQLQDRLSASDPDGDDISYSLVSDVSNGTLLLSADGAFAYTPNSNFNGEDSFIARASDGDSFSSGLRYSIQIDAINDAPTIQSVSKITRLDQAVTFMLAAEDVDGDLLSYQIVSQPGKGIATLNQDNSVTYAPELGSLGLDQFDIEVSDQLLTAVADITLDNNLAFEGLISGDVDSMQGIEALLTADGHLRKTTPDYSGRFKFYGLPDGEYAIKVRKRGYRSSPAMLFALNIAELNSDDNPVQNTSQTDIFELVALDSNNFSFHWEEDQSTAGHDYAAHINVPLTVEFLYEQLEILDDASSNQLHHDFNILLVDSNTASWSQEHAYRILETMKSIPQQRRDPYAIQSLSASKWMLTSDYIEDDIQITTNGERKTVLVSEAAFVYASPRIAKVDGKRGAYYSQRLHHALVRFITGNGTDEAAYEKILQERFGVSTLVSDYEALTTPTGGESAGRFQPFHPEEIVQLINMFEEMPKGMHILPELQYLIRRLDGTPHPLYDDAPAVAWAANGYIEFMESAFNTSNVAHMHRLIIHEKSHFLWANQFSRELKDNWIVLGGWYEDPESDTGWSTTRQTEFVSAYAHLESPNEDMAESISYFIIDPDLLKSRAIGKYEFVRDFIMQGNIYIAQIQQDLTFQVYNLYPDYVFPGKIKRVDIDLVGEPEEDKTVTVEIELHALDTELEGAQLAYMRILSEIGTFTDLYLYPVDENGIQLGIESPSTILRGSFSLSKYAKAGFWRTPQIVITDAVGNQRLEGANDFGWKLYVNNPLEDIIPPEYVLGTANLAKSIAEREGQEVQIVHSTWQVNEAIQMREDNNACYASMNDELPETYRVEEYGRYDEITETCMVDFIMPHYMPSSIYSMNYIVMFDQALNTRGTYFTVSEVREDSVDELPQQIDLITNNPDTELPELDLNDIQISAVATNPDTPNGETLVAITFRVRDNISGYNVASLNLRDPQGIDHQYYVYNDDTWSLFPTDDPTAWRTYTRNVVLPVGSAPGIWGISAMTIYDRAGNFKMYDFTEIFHFDVAE